MGLVGMVPWADGPTIEADRMSWLGRAGTRMLDERAREADLVEFVGANYPRLIRLAGLICRDVTDAEDVVQVALERAWKQRLTIRQPGSLSTWLDRIVVREAIRLGRTRRPWLSRLFPGPVETEVRRGPDHDETGSAAVMRIVLRCAFAALPAGERGVGAGRLDQGHSMAETAEIVGIPLETARSRLRLARERLRADLGEVAR
jgi:RNA polymerase sigma-70 factor (ECF subfamily)